MHPPDFDRIMYDHCISFISCLSSNNLLSHNMNTVSSNNRVVLLSALLTF